MAISNTGDMGISFYPRRFCVPAGRQVLVLLDITKREFKSTTY
jgi:hypothetical protein